MAKKAFISASKPVVTVNAKELLRELTSDRPNNKSMAKALRNIIGPKIRRKTKRANVKEFSSHPITIELNAGPRASQY